jgi:hypothetical protein
MAKITILIVDGRVQAVDGIPVDMYLEVPNCDVECLPEGVISKDENGKPCHIREWRAPE